MLQLMKAEDYHEDYGDCLFLHFESFEEPPDAFIGTPLDSDFTDNYWTHFIRMEFNHILEQAIDMARKGDKPND